MQLCRASNGAAHQHRSRAQQRHTSLCQPRITMPASSTLGDNLEYLRPGSTSRKVVATATNPEGSSQRQAVTEPLRYAGEAARGEKLGAATPDASKLAKEGQPRGLLHNVWKQDEQKPKYPALTKNEGEVDVVVIGAGIVGVNIAYQLVSQGKKVALIEGRVRGAGQSGRTSAHIMQWIDDFYYEMESKFGQKNNKLIAQSMNDAIDFLERVVKTENIECNFKRSPGYLFPAEYNEETLSELVQEVDACKRAGMDDVQKVTFPDDPKYGAGLAGREAVLFPKSADFNPVQYVNGVVDALAKKGVKIFEMSNVKGLKKGIDMNGTVHAETGGQIRAREAVVLATNSPTNTNLAIHARQTPYRSYMLGLEVKKGSVAHASWWTTEEIYHYIRIQEEEDRDVLLIGGEDHPTGQTETDYEDSWAKLEKFARERWPQAGEVVYRWSGMVYEPVDNLGMYGKDPLDPAGVLPGAVPRYVATGDSGQGMTGSAIAAMVISAQICGTPSPYIDLYSTERLRTAARPSSLEALGEQIEDTARGYLERVLPRSGTDVAGVVNPGGKDKYLEPGEGAVVLAGNNKIAMYRDPEGTLHKMSGVCPHMGCALAWNPNDATFDCCCHGSQFDRTGHCIQGPACSDLEDMGTVSAQGAQASLQ